MYSPVMELQSFDEVDLETRKSMLRLFLEALIGTNRMYIRQKHPPSLYQLAPQYKFKVRPFGLDSWQDIPRTMALRDGDCKDFACWRVAELREAGQTDVFPRVIANVSNGLIVYHIQVVVDTPQGPKVEDPSAILGMPPTMTEAHAKSLIVGPTQGGVNGIAAAIRGGMAGSAMRGLPSQPPAAFQKLFPWYMSPLPMGKLGPRPAMVSGPFGNHCPACGGGPYFNAGLMHRVDCPTIRPTPYR